ncbi:hypothetical protein V5O48_017092 [Marasmius crinis-equi]|uniref:Transcription factor domain-containing protein n=1 Tax=Marasmius crinis-equi TaxID=585013 RepID=A0ABR3EPW8_9AGAR
MDIRRSTLSWFFSSYASAFGLFVNTSRLIEEACAPYPLGHPSRPCPGLMYTIYFLIAYLNSQDGPDYLAQVVLQVGLMLSPTTSEQTHPKALVQTIQAQVLLANYFFLEDRTLKGKYHLGMAVSLVSSARLYTYASVEDGEKVNAFWMVYSMHSVWDPPGSAVEERKIDVPWPTDEQSIPGSWASQPTITRFLSGGTGSTSQGQPSLMELYSKACILFSRATCIANTSIDSMNTSSRNQLIAARNHLDSLIDNFTAQLPPVAAQESEVQAQTVILIRTLTYASTIQLAYARSNTKSLAVARAAVNLLQAPGQLQVLLVNPIFGVLWGIIGRVLVDEIRWLHLSRAVRNQIAEAERTLDVLVTTIQGLTRGTFIGYQIGKLREALGMDM